MTSLTDLWSSLSPALQVFYGIGLISLLVVTVQTVLSLIGLDIEGFDGLDANVDFGSGISLFSSQALGAFFLGFGWMGAGSLSSGFPLIASIFFAMICGVGAMAAMVHMLRLLLRLQSKGNLVYSSAIGQEATVYVTVQPREQGSGQIQVLVQDRLTTADAITEGNAPFAPGERVLVHATRGNTFVVSALKHLPH
jgi:membrane protein implicated in regulation of membrane protease activity